MNGGYLRICWGLVDETGEDNHVANIVPSLDWGKIYNGEVKH